MQDHKLLGSMVFTGFEVGLAASCHPLLFVSYLLTVDMQTRAAYDLTASGQHGKCCQVEMAGQTRTQQG